MVKLRICWATYGLITGIILATIFDNVIIRL